MLAFIRKIPALFMAAIMLLHAPHGATQGLDPRLRDDMQARHYEPGGKYHLFGGGRGSVTKRTYNVTPFFTGIAVEPVLPISHERSGFEGSLGYETHFSGHGHEEHSPFANQNSKSQSDFRGGVDGGFTVYTLHRTGSEVHPADGYDGPQGGGYPAPTGARDIYRYQIKGTATKTKINPLPRSTLAERWQKENASAIPDFVRRAEEAGRLIREHNPRLNGWGNAMESVRGIAQGALSPIGISTQGLGTGALWSSATEGVAHNTAIIGMRALHALPHAARLAAAQAMQNSAFAVKSGMQAIGNWAHAHPNMAETAKVAGIALGTYVGAKTYTSTSTWLSPASKNHGQAANKSISQQAAPAGTAAPQNTLPESKLHKGHSNHTPASADATPSVSGTAHSSQTPSPVRYSGGKPVIDGDPYSPASVEARIPLNRANMQINDIALHHASPGDKTSGQSAQYIKKGSYEDAKADFESLNPQNIQHRSDGLITGDLPDGRKINARIQSTYQKKPTLEIQYGKKRRIKIRYTP